jgi:hypothetical protein
MGGKFGLNSEGRTLNIKKIKEGVVGNTKVVFKGDRVRIAIGAIKPLRQRDVALQSNIDSITRAKEIYDVRQVSIPKNGIAVPYYYLEGKYDKQQFYSQELQGVDAVEAPTQVAVRYIVSDLIYPLAKNNQPQYRVRCKIYRKANGQIDEPRRQLVQDVGDKAGVCNLEADWNVAFVQKS